MTLNDPLNGVIALILRFFRRVRQLCWSQWLKIDL